MDVTFPSYSTCIMENAEGARNLNLDFGGYGTAHRRRLRPTSGPSDDDLDTNHRDVTDALPNTRHVILLPVPFTSRSCEICLQQKKGDYILNLKAAIQHARSHHCGVSVLYACNICSKTYMGKHAAQCHVPKCRGPPTMESKDVICQIRKKAFRYQRGLSTHERLMHPLERN